MGTDMQVIMKNIILYQSHQVGSNDKENLVKLTAREHFICHWLLVKTYKKNTNERIKMIWAFHRMCFSSTGERITNSKTFEKYKIEFCENISKINKTHKGELNSQFGKFWFTNLKNGESKRFYERPDEFWIEGRNWFNNEGKTLYDIKDHHKIHFEHNKIVIEKWKSLQNKVEENTNKIKKLWDEFHDSNYKNITDFSKQNNYNEKIIAARFKRYIPLYTKLKTQSKNGFCPNKKYIGLYE